MEFIWKTRSNKKELLDLGSNYYTKKEYAHCLKMLFRVNYLFGTFYSTKQTLKKFPKNSSLIDIGCGGGLFLLKLSQYFPNMRLRGYDISQEAIQCAQQELQDWQMKSQACNVSFHLQAIPSLEIAEDNIDVVLSTLVCHHLTDSEIIHFLQKSQSLARKAVIINDLHRHPLAYFFYALLSPFLFRNRLITHDGLISIQRGFTRKEWEFYLNQAKISQYQIKWCFPFRWKIILWKK